jgi:hypothetical protein
MMRTLAASLGLLLAVIAVPSAQRPTAAELEVKAAYLYNFTRFVAWPMRTDNATDPFSICVLGADPFGHVLDTTLKGVAVRGAMVVPRRIAEPAESNGCHVLFISASEERRVSSIMTVLAHADVLTVSDMPKFVVRGGMIQFVNEGGRVRFEIGLVPAQDAGLSLSSELLRVALAVRRERLGA